MARTTRSRAKRTPEVVINLSSDEDDEVHYLLADKRNSRKRPRGGDSKENATPAVLNNQPKYDSTSGASTSKISRDSSVVIVDSPSKNTRSRLPLKLTCPVKLTIGQRCLQEVDLLKTKYGEDSSGWGVKIQTQRASGSTTVSLFISPLLNRIRSFNLKFIPLTGQSQVIQGLKHFPPILIRMEFSENTHKISVHSTWMNKVHTKNMKRLAEKAFRDHTGNEPLQAAISLLETRGLDASGILVHRWVTYAVPNPDRDDSEKVVKIDDLAPIRAMFEQTGLARNKIHQTQELRNCHAFDCLICFERKPVMTAVIFDNCHHHFCKDCVEHDFNLKIRENRLKELQCLAEGCSSTVASDLVKLTVGKESFQRYCDLTADNLVTGPSFVRCPKKICNTPMELAPGASREVQCVACRHRFCATCKGKQHTGRPCLTAEQKREIREQYQRANPREKKALEERYGVDNVKFALEDAESEDWIAKNAKPCPKCKTPIQKTDGCNKMICTAYGCKTYFCWLCGVALPHNNPYQHFQEGACNGRLHEGNNQVNMMFGNLEMLAGGDDDDDEDSDAYEDFLIDMLGFPHDQNDDSDSDDDELFGGPFQFNPNAHMIPPFGNYYFGELDEDEAGYDSDDDEMDEDENEIDDDDDEIDDDDDDGF